MDILKALQIALMKGYSTTQINITEVCTCLILAALIALYIFFFYRWFAKNTFYDRNFSLSLIGMSLLSAAVLLTVQSSIVVSVGMVGALSIVRFRTAVKDPMDLVFLFWAIVTGIICGAGFALIAILASFALTLILMLLIQLPKANPTQLLVINADSKEMLEPIQALLQSQCKKNRICSRNITPSGLNMSVEIKTENENQLIDSLMQLPGIRSASLVAHNGDLTV